jgi:glutathione S-transferase
MYDSRVITRYLDRKSGGKLYPTSDAALLEVECIEALTDGINDCAVGYMYEMRFRPEEKVHKPWQDRLWGKAERALDAISRDLPPAEKGINMASIALAATLGYLDLRFAGKWETGRGKLVEWRDAFAAAHPDLAALKPSA